MEYSDAPPTHLGTNAPAALKMVANYAVDLGMSVVGEDEPQGKANRCREYASGNPDYDPRKDALAAIAGSVRWFVVVHTESIHPGCRPTPAPHRRDCDPPRHLRARG